jgi:hypothetical protein
VGLEHYYGRQSCQKEKIAKKLGVGLTAEGIENFEIYTGVKFILEYPNNLSTDIREFFMYE